jgi:guanylate kinase
MEHWTRANAGFPVVVSGPSGVGKTSVVDRLLLLDPRCVRSVSATTRAPRGGEIDGESYSFVSERKFEELQQRGELAESAIYNGHWYGTPKSFLEERIASGLSVILNIEVQGGLQVRRHYPDAVLVFVLPPSWEDLRGRLMGRGTDRPEVVEGRIRRAHEELQEVERYDYVIINDLLDPCVAELGAIIRAERRRVSRLRAQVQGGPA